MPRYYKATINVLVVADSEDEAGDAVAEAMWPMLRLFAPWSSLIDWVYVEDPHPSDARGFEYAAPSDLTT